MEHLQEILFIDHNYPKNKLDGKFGSLTEKSLKSFQKGHGLAITGIVDEATQNKLNAVSQSELTLEVPGDYILFETNLKQGDQNKNVFALQRFLVYEGSFSASDVNGIYGKKTKQSVMVFQRKYGIFPPVGYAGYKTRHKMRQLSGL